MPVLPWFGVVAIGIGLAGLWRQRQYALPQSWRTLESAPARALRWLGCWPLTIYLVHQPVLMGVLALVRYAMAS